MKTSISPLPMLSPLDSTGVMRQKSQKMMATDKMQSLTGSKRIAPDGSMKANSPEFISANKEVLKQNINVQLYEVLKESGIDYNTIKVMVKHKTRISQNYKRSQNTLMSDKVKNWRTTRKMMVHKDVGKEYKDKLRLFYNNIVGDRKIDGIGIDELEDPLITLGISKSRTEIENILSSFKTHIPGRLSFDEFLSILNGNRIQKRNTSSSTAILEFFRSMCYLHKT
jgi:Ca2+-binding EF-hand superfamily protein